MLVLSRKVGEELIIGDNIRITITEISNGRVKIGVAAPREVHVIRAELEAVPAIVTTSQDAGLQEILAARGRSLERHTEVVRGRRDILAKPLPR